MTALLHTEYEGCSLRALPHLHNQSQEADLLGTALRKESYLTPLSHQSLPSSTEAFSQVRAILPVSSVNLPLSFINVPRFMPEPSSSSCQKKKPAWPSKAQAQFEHHLFTSLTPFGQKANQTCLHTARKKPRIVRLISARSTAYVGCGATRGRAERQLEGQMCVCLSDWGRPSWRYVQSRLRPTTSCK